MLKKTLKNSGFTLIEMLVAIFVFMILFLIAASFVNLAAGSTKSNRTKLLTNDVRTTLDVISQKLNTANGKATIGSIPVYGFRVNNGILAIVNESNLSTGVSIKKCSFIAKITDNNISGIYIKEVDCTSSSPAWPELQLIPVQNPGLNGFSQPLTNIKSINVSNLTFTASDIMINQSPTKSPYIKISITANDTDPKYSADNVIVSGFFTHPGNVDQNQTGH